ncbi:uncharacterized protein LOC121373127 [Gigantopelta aegis]|uniref:uncharacterized protein LOC121373127 n=1 Tax=Gigantopelta aegis TaxID=1735272 RepID=UPI001B88BD65|nr:uncharacterized protein LOC121373127 [Gigantopelta aegis]
MARACPRPTSSTLITAQNQKDVDIDPTNYKNSSTKLPLLCHDAVFELKETAYANCVGGKWILETHTCVAKIWRKRERTKQIILITGLVVGGLAVLFLILKVVQYRWEKTQKKIMDDIELNSIASPRFTRVRDNEYTDIFDSRPTDVERRSRQFLSGISRTQSQTVFPWHNQPPAYSPSSNSLPGISRL